MRYRLPHDVQAEVLARFDADPNATVGEIARDLQITRSWAAHVLREAGRNPDARWRRLTPERLAEARARVDAGQTIVETAERIGVHEGTLRQALRADGLAPQFSPPPMDDEQAAEVRRLYATGAYSKAALGRLFRRGHCAIDTALRGGPREQGPNPRRLTAEQQADIARLYTAGAPIARICRQVGVGETSVYRLLHHRGLKRRYEDRVQEPDAD
jgi:transposase-like protein